ncbi:MAG TPA: penicillin-binding protein 2 [Mycobacteriales bacterium]|nr:penicillin-binding protein 2 [Mycobacteriales bacterium]
MPDSFPLRLAILRVLVVSLLVTLAARLYYLQVLDQDKLVQTANRQHVREVILPAPRGAIVDDRGRPLVTNRSSLVVSVNRSELLAEHDQGAAVLARLAKLIKVPAAELARRITPCAPDVPKPCWNGSPYQPVPVLTDTTPDVVLKIAERREDYPGVTAEAQTLRQYPYGSLAAHSLGYVGPVTQEELDAAAGRAASGRPGGPALHLNAQVGRSGLERTYDGDLRGTDGVRYVTVDNRGTVLGVQRETEPQRGDTLVTSLDRDVQAIADRALAAEIARRRTEIDQNTGRPYAAPSGAAVVMDPQTGRVIALSTSPTYDPTVFVGGISRKELAQLTDERAGVPLVSRAVQGQFAPGSTFKLASTSAEVMSGRASLSGSYSCPGSLLVGNRQKKNFEGQGIAGAIDLRVALAKSCDTIFYGFAQQDWYSDESRVDGGQKAAEVLQRMARAYGFGRDPAIDLPDGEQTAGRIVDRAFKKGRWDANKAQYCADARRGYPDVADAARRSFLTRLAQENCADGWRFRVGDAADLAIGQGETTVSPLQLAIAYSALVNGGTVWEPRIGRAVLGPDGRVLRDLKSKAHNKVPVSAQVLDYIRSSLAFTPANGASGSVAFAGFPLDKVLVGGKTGTAEVFGKQDTSWFASWAPANGRARYVVVAMIEQAGLGARAAAPVARTILEGIYGLNGTKAAFPGGAAPTAIPKVAGNTAARSDRRSPTGTGTPPVPSPPASSPSPAVTRSPRRPRRERREAPRRRSRGSAADGPGPGPAGRPRRRSGDCAGGRGSPTPVRPDPGGRVGGCAPGAGEGREGLGKGGAPT